MIYNKIEEKERTMKITKEYVAFIKRTNELVDEVKRATVLALGKILSLEEGDAVVINEDGTMQVEREEKDGSVTLNGRKITKDELERQKEIAKKQGGAKLEEDSKGNYRLHLRG